MNSFAYAVGDATQLYAHAAARSAALLLDPVAQMPVFDHFSAYAQALAGVTAIRGKPEFGIPGTETEIVQSLPFCDLVHFKCEGSQNRPRLLLVAPLSGHYATLLRGTVEELIKHFDVSITDWKNACRVPLRAGKFDFDSFVDYCDDFLGKTEPDAVMAICQPGPALAAALALREANGLKNPRAAIFMGSPIDARVSPTAVTKLAQEQSLDWFEQNLIQIVPFTYPGAGRKVYPGRTQLGSFVAMNLGAHRKKHVQHIMNIARGDEVAVEAHNKFYNEYLSVLDLPAEFYLQTVDVVFQQFSLPKGTLVHDGQRVDMSAINKTAILVVEGEKDDISAPGQTLALHDMCSNLASRKKTALLVPEAGHYGIFNGGRFKGIVVPAVAAFVQQTLTSQSRARSLNAAVTHGRARIVAQPA